MSDTDALSLLEAHVTSISDGFKLLAERCRDAGINSTLSGAPSPPVIPSDAPAEIHRQRQTLLAGAIRLQTLLSEPMDFIQNLAKQVGSLFFNRAMHSTFPQPLGYYFLRAESWSEMQF